MTGTLDALISAHRVTADRILGLQLVLASDDDDAAVSSEASGVVGALEKEQIAIASAIDSMRRFIAKRDARLSKRQPARLLPLPPTFTLPPFKVGNR